jgi:hypothetical protein
MQAYFPGQYTQQLKCAMAWSYLKLEKKEMQEIVKARTLGFEVAETMTSEEVAAISGAWAYPTPRPITYVYDPDLKIRVRDDEL